MDEKMIKHSMRKVILMAVIVMFPLMAASQNATTETVTTVADQGKSGMFLTPFCPQKDVAISKNDAEVFSIYTEAGSPNLLKLRVRNGMFVIKAGEPVIVKTTEPMAVELSTTNKPSSTFLNDVICLNADKSVADYKKDNSLDDNATIYMLTNMESNGGFGFTKFTGDTMLRGNFFIVITNNKTRAAEDIEDGEPVPLLEGEAGNNDGFTAQSVYTKGDANGDGKVNVADIVEIVNYIQKTPSASFLTDPADANSDGEIDTADIETIIETIIGKK